MKIAVYSIALNEAQFAERWAVSAKDADLILVADTGSTDGTQDILRANDVRVHDVHVAPWRFDTARNTSLNLIPADIDVCIALDLDETLTEGWRDHLESVWTAPTTRLRYLFDWGSGIRFYGEKIHSRNGYLWKHPCHERLVNDLRAPEVLTWTDHLLVVHRPDDAKSRGQYMGLLDLAVRENPTDARGVLYQARERWFMGDREGCIAGLSRYLDMPDGWSVERSYAMRIMAQCHTDPVMALRWARTATAEESDAREPWILLASLCYAQGRWGECYGAALSALEIAKPSLNYTADPEAFGPNPHDLAAIAAWNLGLIGDAERHARDALALSPTDPRLQSNLRLIQGDAAA